MFLFGKKTEKQYLPPFKEALTIEERQSLRIKLEDKYPKVGFTYVVVEGLGQFENQSKDYFVYKFGNVEWG